MPETVPVAALALCVLGRNLLGAAGNVVSLLETILLVDPRIPRCPSRPDPIARELLTLVDATAASAG